MGPGLLATRRCRKQHQDCPAIFERVNGPGSFRRPLLGGVKRRTTQYRSHGLEIGAETAEARQLLERAPRHLSIERPFRERRGRTRHRKARQPRTASRNTGAAEGSFSSRALEIVEKTGAQRSTCRRCSLWAKELYRGEAALDRAATSDLPQEPVPVGSRTLVRTGLRTIPPSPRAKRYRRQTHHPDKAHDLAARIRRNGKNRCKHPCSAGPPRSEATTVGWSMGRRRAHTRAADPWRQTEVVGARGRARLAESISTGPRMRPAETGAPSAFRTMTLSKPVLPPEVLDGLAETPSAPSPRRSGCIETRLQWGVKGGEWSECP